MTGSLVANDTYARRDFLIGVVLLANGLAWFFIAVAMIDNMVVQLGLAGEKEMLVYLIYFVFASLSAFVGSILRDKISRTSLIRVWVVLGIAASIFPILISEIYLPQILIISAILGFSFGLGMPSSLSYFVDITTFENRGFFSGLIFMITNLIVPVFAFIRSANLVVNCLTSATWKSIGLLAFFIKPMPKQEDQLAVGKNEKSFTHILSKRPFILYFTAWLMFCFIERTETPLISDLFGDFSTVVFSMGPLIGGISSFVAGILCDRIGRKKIILFCFAIFGVAYAVIGLAPYSIFSWYLYLGIHSITSGALWMIFILIIWGELANSKRSERYYALGEAPYFLAYVAQLLVTPFVLEIEKISAFSLAAFFLFLAVIPLMYAPETLPEKRIKERELKEYVEKARKVSEKYT